MEFRFAYPLVFVLLLLPVGLYLIPALAHWRPNALTMRYSDTRLLSGLKTSWRIRLRHLPDVLRLLAWILLVVALARPQTGRSEEIIRGEGVDIVLALDISSSMAAIDFEPQNRLEAAKTVIGDFIDGREFDRVGLVVFARTAYHQVPLTLNYQVVKRLLGEVRLVTDLRQPGGLQLDGTAIGLGLASSANMLRSSTAPSRVIILLTDGDNNAGVDPIAAASAVATLGIRVYTIGMGAPGMMEIPGRDGTTLTLESDLNEEILQEIARIGNGLYFRADDTGGLRRIYEQIDRLERADVERVIFVPWHDRAMWLLVATLALLTTERTLRRTVFESVL
jgi:Ca-activated chloride channel homolog